MKFSNGTETNIHSFEQQGVVHQSISGLYDGISQVSLRKDATTIVYSKDRFEHIPHEYKHEHKHGHKHGHKHAYINQEINHELNTSNANDNIPQTKINLNDNNEKECIEHEDGNLDTITKNEIIEYIHFEDTSDDEGILEDGIKSAVGDTADDGKKDSKKYNLHSLNENLSLFSNRPYVLEIEEIFKAPIRKDGIFRDAAQALYQQQFLNVNIDGEVDLNEILTTQQAHFSRLGLILRHLELKEQHLLHLKNVQDSDLDQSIAAEQLEALQTETKMYDSEGGEDEGNDTDSFIDDTDYDRYVSGMASNTMGDYDMFMSSSHRAYNNDVSQYSQDNYDFEDYSDNESSSVQQQRTESSPRQKRNQNITPELEDSLSNLEEKLEKVKIEKYSDAEEEPKDIPLEDVIDELARVPRFQDENVVSRIKTMPLMANFEPRTKGLKKCLESHLAAKKSKANIAQLQQKLKEFVRHEIINALLRKYAKDKDTKEKAKLRTEYSQKTHQELIELFNMKDTTTVRMNWSSEIHETFEKLVNELHTFITDTNYVKKFIQKKGSKQKLLNEKKQFDKLYEEIEPFWPKPPNFKEKIQIVDSEKKSKKEGKSSSQRESKSSEKSKQKMSKKNNEEASPKEKSIENETKKKKNKEEKVEQTNTKKRKRVSCDKNTPENKRLCSQGSVESTTPNPSHDSNNTAPAQNFQGTQNTQNTQELQSSQETQKFQNRVDFVIHHIPYRSQL